MSGIFSNTYQYFLAVAQTGNFHKAAQRLYVSQSAVSKQIKILEETLGYQLFSRTTRTVNLTAEGRILYAALSECVQIMNKASEKIAKESTRRSLSGTLRIGVLSSWDIGQFRMPYFTRFFQENVDVEMLLARLDHRELIERLKQNELDIVVTPLRELESESGINYISLGKYPLMLILSKKHPLAHYDDIFDKLDGVDMYTHHKESVSVANNLNKIGINPNIVLVPNVDSKIAAAENGQGCTVVLSVSKAARSPDIRAYPLRNIALELVVAYKNGEDPLIDAFLNHIIELTKLDTGI